MNVLVVERTQQIDYGPMIRGSSAQRRNIVCNATGEALFRSSNRDFLALFSSYCVLPWQHYRGQRVAGASSFAPMLAV